jgi:hypothetical protein
MSVGYSITTKDPEIDSEDDRSESEMSNED